MVKASTKREREPASFPQGREMLLSVMENAPIGMSLVDWDGRTVFINQACADMFRTSRAELAALSLSDIIVPEMLEDSAAALQAIIRGDSEGHRAERIFVRADGTRFWGLIAVSVLRPEAGAEQPFLIVQLIDIDVEKRTEATVTAAESRWNFALESAGQGVWDHDLRTGTSFYSRTWKVMRGLDPDAPVDASEAVWLARVHPDDRAFASKHERMLRSGETERHEFEYRERRADGRMIWILSRGRAVAWNADGSVARVIGTDTDVTRIKSTETQLADVISTMSDGVVLFDLDERLVFRNEQYPRLFPYTADIRVPGARLTDILRTSVAAGELRLSEPGESYIERTRNGLRAGGEWEFELSDGRWLAVRARPVADGGGYLSVVSDITRRKRAELDQADLNRRLETLAHFDGLTGLINRRSFDELLATEFQRSMRERKPLTLLLIDVDHFKAYNDAYGHPAGDDCLRAMARTLLAALRRPGDRAARIGGEEFAVILPDTEAAGGTIVAQAIREAVRGLGLRHDRSLERRVTVSVGVADLDGSNPPASVRRFVARADEALYAAKAAGRDKVVTLRAETKTGRESDSPGGGDGWWGGV